jgi:hypothetical protein
VAAATSVPRPLELVFFEETGRHGFQVMMLTHLPVIHCGRMNSALDFLAGAPALLDTLAKATPMPSYVWYIPMRLGYSPMLDAAADLVFTAAGHLLTSPRSHKHFELMRKYGVALSAVRSAIIDPLESLSADTLAAISLLSTWEVRCRMEGMSLVADASRSVFTRRRSPHGSTTTEGCTGS